VSYFVSSAYESDGNFTKLHI